MEHSTGLNPAYRLARSPPSFPCEVPLPIPLKTRVLWRSAGGAPVRVCLMSGEGHPGKTKSTTVHEYEWQPPCVPAPPPHASRCALVYFTSSLAHTQRQCEPGLHFNYACFFFGGLRLPGPGTPPKRVPDWPLEEGFLLLFPAPTLFIFLSSSEEFLGGSIS